MQPFVNVPIFKNLFTFLESPEFCPLCNKRLSVVSGTQYITFSLLTAKHFILYSFDNEAFKINLIDNSFIYFDNPALYAKNITNTFELKIIKQCNRYHYQHMANVVLNLDTKFVDYIYTTNKHINEKSNKNYYSININYPENKTNIKITSGGNKTRELILSGTKLDLDNKKKILRKLRVIEIL